MKYLFSMILMLLASCANMSTPEGQHRLGTIIATIYKYKESTMPLKYRIAAQTAYRVLTVLTMEEKANGLDAINKLIEDVGAKNSLDEAQIALAKATFSQVYARAKLGTVSQKSRLERLRHIKSGIDLIVN